jgi:hypothetical protein
LVSCAGLTATAASADSSVIPDTPDLPWADPNHQSPLEVVVSQIASSLVGRPVRVYCNDQNAWDALVARLGVPGSAWGFAQTPRFNPVLGMWTEDAKNIQLAVKPCEQLWEFAKASTKPTRCAAYGTTTQTIRVSVRYRASVPVVVRKRVKVNGRWVTRSVRRTRLVWKTRMETRTKDVQVQLGSLPCYSKRQPGVTLSPFPGGTAAYAELVYGIMTVSHESGHIRDMRSGTPVVRSTATVESRAECYGLQNLAGVAIALGAAADDAANMQRWYWENTYPLRQTTAPDYWSADCHEDGPLDFSPGDGVWP